MHFCLAWSAQQVEGSEKDGSEKNRAAANIAEDRAAKDEGQRPADCDRRSCDNCQPDHHHALTAAVCAGAAMQRCSDEEGSGDDEECGRDVFGNWGLTEEVRLLRRLPTFIHDELQNVGTFVRPEQNNQRLCKQACQIDHRQVVKEISEFDWQESLLEGRFGRQKSEKNKYIILFRGLK